MASLSNINGLFDVHSTGAILFSNTHGTSGQILKSNGNAAPTWVAPSAIIGGPYLPLTGGTLTGPLIGTSAAFSGNLSAIAGTFAGNATFSNRVTVNGYFQVNSTTRLGGAVTIEGDVFMDGYDITSINELSASTATFTGDITLGDDLNFTTNGFADISNTGTGAMRFKPSSQTLALTLTGANATFAGNVGIGSAPVGNPATKFLAVGTAGSVAGGIQLWATNAQTHYIQFGDAASGGNYYRGAIGYAHASDTLLLLQSGSTALSFTGSQEATFAGNVGIGKAPAKTLDVEGNIRAINTAGSAAAEIDISSGATWRLRSNPTSGTNSYGLDIIKGGAGTDVKMTINSDGNVGIGTTSPDAKLSIYSTATFDSRSSGVNVHRPGSFGQYGSVAYDGGEMQISSTYTGNGAADYGSIKFQQFNNGTTPRVVMFLNTAGNIGIGTTAPSTKLTISGVQELLQLTRGGASDTKWFFSADSTRLFIAENTSATANIKLTINENGNVGIGTSTPGYKLDVSDEVRVVGGLNITAQTGTLYNTDGALSYYSSANGVYLNGAGASGWLRLQGSGVENNRNSINIYGSAGDLINFQTANVTRLVINSSGNAIFTNNVGIGTTTPYSRLDVTGVLSIGVASSDPSFTVASTGMSLINGGSLDIVQGFAGTSSAGDTLVFKYEATSWKAWQLEYCISAAYGFLKGGVGGYLNTGTPQAYYYITTNQGSNMNISSVVATSGGANNQHVIITITGIFGIHTCVRMKYTQSGGDGAPRADRASLTFNS